MVIANRLAIAITTPRTTRVINAVSSYLTGDETEIRDISTGEENSITSMKRDHDE